MAIKTAAQIDAYVTRMLAHYTRLLEAGEITQKDHDAGLRDLARWSAAKYAALPHAQAVDAILKLLTPGGHHG